MDYEKLKDLTPEMKATFERLQRVIMKDYGPNAVDSEQLYRFLVARDFHFDRAENLLRNHIEWKKDIEKNSKTFKKTQLQEENVKLHFVSFTKEGHPFLYIDIGNVDFKGLLKCVKCNDIINGLIYDVLEIEKLLDAQSKKLGKRINVWTVVLNYENLHISQVLNKSGIDFFLQLFSTYEANFPERLKLGIVINASPIFTILFNLIKPILSPNTLAKTKIIGTEGWKEILQNEVHENDLPVFLGGKMVGTNGDPYCNTIRVENPIPKHYYFRSPERRLRFMKDISECIIKRSETYDIMYNVDQINSEIFWNFETEKGNIAFCLIYKNKTGTSEEIIPLKSVNAHMELEEGSYLCYRTGTYILQLNNTHSWLREKHVFYIALIKKPNGESTFIRN